MAEKTQTTETPGGTPVAEVRKKDQDSPANPSPAYNDMQPERKLCRDVFGGNRTVKAEGATYLPQNPDESNEAWKARKARTPFFNAFKKTVNGLTGLAFRKNSTLDVKDKELEEQLEDNIDLTGKTWIKFAEEILQNGLIDGGSGILIDMPVQGQAETKEDEKKLNIRPYWVGVPAQDILSWRYENRSGNLVLTQVVLRFWTEEHKNEFGRRTRREYRVYREDAWQVWLHPLTKDGEENDDEVFLESEGQHTLGMVPFVLASLAPENFFVFRPPLVDLAYENVGHYQLRSDYLNSLHYASVAVLAIIGAETEEEDEGDGKKQRTWSADTFLQLPENGNAKFVEHSGKAIGASKEEIATVEERMGKMGLAMLASQDPDTKATKIRFDKSENDSQLSRIMGELENALNAAIRIHQKWRGKEDTDSAVVLNRDFLPEPLTSAEIKEISAMVKSGQLSLVTMWELLVKGEILPEDFDPEEEKERIAAESNLGLGSPDEEEESEEVEEEPEVEPAPKPKPETEEDDEDDSAAG